MYVCVCKSILHDFIYITLNDYFSYITYLTVLRYKNDMIKLRKHGVIQSQ